MKHLNIFVITLIIFLIILFLSSLLFLINTPELEKYLKTLPTLVKTALFLLNHIIQIHSYFIVFSLFITFSVYYAFIDLEIFRVRNYILAIIIIPIIICTGIYYFENYIFKELFQFKTSVMLSPAANYYTVSNINDLKIYHFAFLIFIVIPGAVLLNNRKWYLKTVMFLLIYLILTVNIFKYVNSFILDLLDKIEMLKDLKKSLVIKELILSIVYLPIGISLFKAADSIHKIRKRIDLGKIKKIQYE